MIKRALERPLFGWGGWGGSRIHDEESGRDISVTDGLWIIILGRNGMFGLCAWLLAMALPALLLWRKARSRMWRGPEMAFIVALIAIKAFLELVKRISFVSFAIYRFIVAAAVYMIFM